MTEITRQQAHDLLKHVGEKFLTLDNGVKVKFVGTDKDFTSSIRTTPCRIYSCTLGEALGGTNLEVLNGFVKQKLSEVFALIGVNRDVNIKSLSSLKLVFYVGFNQRCREIKSKILTLFKDENGFFWTPFTSDCENGSKRIDSLNKIDHSIGYYGYSWVDSYIDLKDEDTYSRYVSGNVHVFRTLPYLQKRISELINRGLVKNLRSLTGYINAAINNTTEQDPLRYVHPNKYLSYLLSDNDAETLAILRRYRLCQEIISEPVITTNYTEDF